MIMMRIPIGKLQERLAQLDDHDSHPHSQASGNLELRIADSGEMLFLGVDLQSP